MRSLILVSSILMNLVYITAYAGSRDAELERAGRAAAAREQRHWDDRWLSIVAGAYKVELNTRVRAYFNLEVLDVQLIGFRKTDDAFAKPGKKMRVLLSDGSICMRFAIKGGGQYQWRLYCETPERKHLYEE